MVERAAVTNYLLDSNVWLALVASGHDHQQAAVAWLGTIDEPGSVWFCRATQQSFLRLVTTAAVSARYGDPPLTNDEAWTAFSALCQDDRISLRVEEPPGIETAWRSFAVRSSASPRLWMDAYLAAFARAAGCRLVTLDRAFRQFDGLDVLILGE